MGKKYYIVWNSLRTEGYVTDCIEDAEYVATGIHPGIAVPAAGMGFRDAYAECDYDDPDEFEIHPINIDFN